MAEATTKTPTARAKKAEEADTRTVFQRIIDITNEMPVLEPQKAPGGGIAFAYRGVDATVAHVSPLLNKHGVFITPSGIEHIVSEREAGNRVIKTSQVITTFTVYGAMGDSFEVQTAGLADDFADRSAAQAQSVAYRVALLQLFHIPASGKDPEQTGQEVMDGRDAPATAARPSNPVANANAKAQAATAATSDLSKLQQQAKALGRKLGKQSDDLNAMGVRLGDGDEDWFNSAAVMAAIVNELKAEEAAA